VSRSRRPWDLRRAALQAALRELGVRPGLLRPIAAGALADAVTRNAPRQPTGEQVLGILEAVYQTGVTQVARGATAFGSPSSTVAESLPVDRHDHSDAALISARQNVTGCHRGAPSARRAIAWWADPCPDRTDPVRTWVESLRDMP